MCIRDSIESVQMNHSGNPGAPITLAAYPGHKPAIQHPYNTSIVNMASGGGTASVGWLIFEGFEIYSTLASGNNSAFGIGLHNVHDTIIRRNTIHHSRHGILGTGKNVKIDRNTVYHNGAFDVCATDIKQCNQDHGIYGTGSNWVVINNLIYDNLAYGIQIAAYPFDANLYPDAGYAGASGWLVANNTIAYNNWRAGIILWQSGATNGTFINNIIYQNALKSGSTQGIEFYGSGAGHLVQNNSFYGRTAPFLDTAQSYTASGNLMNSDPLFINAGSSPPPSPNFQVQSGSPTINAGLTVSQVTTDLLGIVRPQAGAYDIGAYEGSSTSSNTPPSPPKNLTVR